MRTIVQMVMLIPGVLKKKNPLNPAKKSYGKICVRAPNVPADRRPEMPSSGALRATFFR
jgi:hypothetical protein